MHSKCISYTFSRKFVTGNGFNDADFLYRVKILAIRRCFRLFCTTAKETEGTKEKSDEKGFREGQAGEGREEKRRREGGLVDLTDTPHLLHSSYAPE